MIWPNSSRNIREWETVAVNSLSDFSHCPLRWESRKLGLPAWATHLYGPFSLMVANLTMGNQPAQKVSHLTLWQSQDFDNLCRWEIFVIHQSPLLFVWGCGNARNCRLDFQHPKLKWLLPDVSSSLSLVGVKGEQLDTHLAVLCLPQTLVVPLMDPSFEMWLIFS